MSFFPKVSVLTTVYNRERFLAACIESVLAQSFQDFEYIIVDDGSTDDSLSVAREYEKKDKRIRVYRNETNLGDYPNRNKAASYARGEYLKYVDADDLIYPHCLDVMVSGMDVFPNAAWGNSLAIPGVLSPAELSPLEAYRCHFLRGYGLFSAGPLGTIIRRKAFESIGGFNGARHTCDSLCWMMLSLKYPLVLVNTGLAWWRHHDSQESLIEGQTSRQVTDVTARRFRNVMAMLHDRECPLSVNEKGIAASNARRDYARFVLRYFRQRQFGAAREAMRQANLNWKDLRYAFRRCPDHAHVPPLSVPRPRWLTEHLKDENSPRSNQENGPRSTLNTRNGGNDISPISPSSTPSVSSVCSVGHHSHPLVSVLIPAYNAEATIGESIASVLAQTFENWELIIVDDASTDRTVEIAQRYSDDPRIRIELNPTRLGKWENHNRCAELARGKYLKFLHADDILFPNALELSTELMTAHTEVALGIGQGYGPFRVGMAVSSRWILRCELLGTPLLMGGFASFMVRRDTFASACQSRDWREPTCRFVQFEQACRWPVVFLPQGLCAHRKCTQVPSMGHNLWPNSWAEGYEWMLDWLNTPACPLDNNERRLAEENLLRYVWRRGDPYHPRSVKGNAIRDRIRVIRFVWRHRLKLRSIVSGSSYKRGWTTATSAEADELIERAGQWTFAAPTNTSASIRPDNVSQDSNIP